jgi:hypothetical protein
MQYSHHNELQSEPDASGGVSVPQRESQAVYFCLSPRRVSFLTRVLIIDTGGVCTNTPPPRPPGATATNAYTAVAPGAGGCRRDYAGPPVNTSPVVNKPPPGGPRGAPRRGERYQQCAEVVGALRAPFFFGPNSCIWVFNGFWWFLGSGASKSEWGRGSEGAGVKKTPGQNRWQLSGRGGVLLTGGPPYCFRAVESF